MEMEEKEKVQSPPVETGRRLKIYILLEHLILAHKVAAKQGRVGSDDIAYSIHFKVFQETQRDKK